MQSARQRVATLGDPAVALRRALTAATSALELLERGAMGSMFDARGHHVISIDRLPEDRPMWIVGDLRGDALALASALAFIDGTDPIEGGASVVFLGDWTGGNAGDAACAAMVLERLVAAPDRTLLLRGDREWPAPLPLQMPAGIRAMPHRADLAKLHQETCDAIESLASRLPALALLPDGVALAHGCLPRASRLEGIDSLDALDAAELPLRDCVLGKLHLREMRVRPIQREGGVLLGVEDFEDSLRALERIIGRPMNRLLRGQDAAPEGFRWFKAYGPGAVLTLVTMGDALPESMGGGRRRPCVGRLKGGRVRVVRMSIPTEMSVLGDQLFPMHSEIQAPQQVVADAPAPHRRESPTPMPQRSATPAPTATPAEPAIARAPVAGDVDPASAARTGPQAARVQFERGVRLLQARAWAGARDAFRAASADATLLDACALNESVACLWMGAGAHQDALARLRMLRQSSPRDPAVLLNMGIAFLVCERNPSEAVRVLRAAVDADPEVHDAWWALGLAAAMRSDAPGAAGAFTRAADGGCNLPVPGSLHGLIPARELGPVLEALRGLARHRPRPEAPPVALRD